MADASLVADILQRRFQLSEPQFCQEQHWKLRDIDLKRNRGTQAMVKSVKELEANTQEFMDKLSDKPDNMKSSINHLL